MADVKKNQSKVYNALKGMGFSGIGANEEDFAAKMSNPKNREKVYKALSSKGYKGIGKDQAAFDSLIYQAPAAQTQVAAPERPAAQQPQIAPQPEQAQAPTPPNQPYKPSELDLMKYGATLGNAQYAADNATKGIDILSKAQKTASPFGTGAASIGNNKNIRKGKQTFDAEKGAFVDTYITSDGRQYKDAQQANNVQADIDYNNDIRRTDETLRSLGVDPEAIRNKDVNHLLGDAYAERDRIKKAMKNDKEGREARISQIMSGGYDPTPNEKLEQRDTYMAALRLLERRIDALETARDNGGFWGGTWDVLTDPSSYSFGLTDLEDAKAMQKISKKIEDAREKGIKPQLTESEKALARNYMLNEQAQAMNAENDWYQMGKGFGQTLSFMKDFAVTGGGFANIAKGGMALGTKAGTKAAAKVFGDYMTKNLGTKVLAKSLIYGGKGLGLAAGAEVGGLALNNTAQAASSMADIMNKQMGHLTVGKDGMLSFEDSKSLGESVLKSTLSRGGENASELVGLAFDAVPGILGRVIQKTKLGQFATKVANSKFWKGYEKGMNYLGISSVWGEGMEEEYNMARDVIIGESNWFKDPDDPNKPAFFDGEQQLKTWETVGITSMLLRVPSMIATGVQGANYYGNLYNLNMSDRQMRDVFGDYEKYEAVKEALDGADNRSLPGTLNNIMNNGGLSKEEKQAMLLYANDLVLLRGFNIANVVAAANGITEQPRVASYQAKGDGKSFDEVDENGNIIEHHEFETSDEMKTALYEAQQKRFDRDLQSDIAAMKTRPNDQYGALLREFCYDNEIDPNEMRAALEKPSMERSDAEQQMVLSFSKILHNTVYDSSMLHEQQSAQDGANIADEIGIDINNISPEQAQQVQEVGAAWNGAKNSRDQLFARNEEIAQEVLSREQQGLSPQEVVSSLDSFNEVDRQIVIDYYNQKVRFEGLINRLGNKIDEEAANSRQRHTFKGTINGQADLSNVYTITDGTNEYFLVSGNITTDSQGKITGSDSGLVIGMDLDGSFVQIKDTDGYSVMPVQQTLDQWEEAERIRLQEQTTGVIATNQTMNPQVQPTEGGNVGDEAGANTGTGGNNPSATAPIDRIPKDAEGNPIYEQGTPEDAFDALVEQIGEQGEQHAAVIAQSQLNAAQKELEKLQKDLAAGKFKSKTPQEQVEEIKTLNQAIASTQQRVKFWQDVLNVPANRKKNNPVEIIKSVIEGIPDGARGKKQLQKYAENLEEALSNNDPISVLNALNSMYETLAEMQDGYKELEDAFNSIEADMKALGYEMTPLKGKQYSEGMRLEAEFVTNTNLSPGENIIKNVRKPQIIKDGKLAQKAEIVVERSPFDSEEDFRENVAHYLEEIMKAENEEALSKIYNEAVGLGIPGELLNDAVDTRNQELAALNDAPEYRYDTPEAARKRGFKKVEGQRIDRQEEKPMPQGMEVEVQYSTKDKVKGRLTVSELGEVQGSHLVNGQRNEKNFIPEAQPKAEFGADRQAAAQTNASEANFRPELMLTFNGTQSAYSGSTTQTNRRGEVIQGNGRRNLAEFIYAPGNEAVAQRYREFLMAHAEELGTTAEAIAQMEKPFAHIVLDVTDEDAIRLGQFTAADLETGGKKIPEVASTATKLGDKFSNLANIVLRHEDPDASLAERIEANADDAVQWLNQGGYINNTEAKTLLEDKAAARQFIKDLLTDTLFSGASPELRTMFYELPKNIQSAIVSVIGREVAASPSTSILKDIQESIQAYHELITSSPQFAGAKGKNFEERFRAVTAAVSDWLRQFNFDGTLNKDKYSNFALHLAKLYQSLKDQKTLAAKLREYYDLVSGSTRQLGMFDDNTTSGPVTREEAIKQIFGVEYGRQGTVPLASDIQAGQGGEQGGSDRNSGGERGEGEGGPADTGGGDTGNAPEGGVGQNPPTPPTPPSANNTPLTTEEIDGSDFPKQVKTLAKAYLNGNHGELQTAAYNDIYEEVRGSQPAAPKSPQQPITTSDPIEAINQAEASFRESQNQKPATPTTPPTPPSGQTETPEQKRARLKQEILAKAQALKDAQKNRKSDGGQAMSVIDPLTALAAEGARIVKKSIIPQSKEERKIFWDLVQTTADYGFTYIQEGVTNFKEWSKRVYDDVVSTMQDIFEWTQEQVDEYINQVWNSEVEVDGKTKTLADFAAEKSNNANDDISSVNVNKKKNNEAENVVSSQQEAPQKPKTKDDWLRKIEGVYQELCKKYGVPEDPIVFNSNTQRYGFDYRITKGYLLDQFEPYYEAYKKKLDDEVEPATEKQLAFIQRLAAEDEKKVLEGAKLNKVSASYVISILKSEESAQTAGEFEDVMNELKKVAELAGKKFDEDLQGDSAEYAEQQEKIERLRNMITDRLRSIVRDGYPAKPLSEYKRFLEIVGIKDMSDTDLQEIIEACIVDLAREFANNDLASEQKKFNWIVKLYNGQPSLNARDNDRINKQQYSTPAPMAYLMGLFVDPQHKANSGLEPSAGNGMLTIALPKEKMHVNDIDEMRLSNLQKQGFGEVTSQDGTKSFGKKKYDVIVTNPPFGSVAPKEWGVYEITSLEQQMALNALDAMKDDGRAAIIIGGNTEYKRNGAVQGKDRQFLNYLYQAYNVVDVINMDGKALYTKQGTGYPVRMILINGRKPKYDPTVYAPVRDKARAEQVKTYDELFKRVNDDILSDTNKPASVHNTESGESNRRNDSGYAGTSSETGVRTEKSEGGTGRHNVLDDNGRSVQLSEPTTNAEGQVQNDGGLDAVESGNTGVVPGTSIRDGVRGGTLVEPNRGASTQNDEDGNRGDGNTVGGNGSERQSSGKSDVSSGGGPRRAGNAQQDNGVQRGLGTEKVPYRQQSNNPFSLHSQMPAEQAEVVKKALEGIGDVDNFLVKELGYNSADELHKALAAEQIDSVALAIHQMNQGNAFIIGDQTGVGKGRQGAALIRYAVKKGGNPVYITKKKDLFSDMYRDLCDIGSPKLRPFIWAADDKNHSADITDKDGNVVYKRPSDKEQKRVVDYINKNGKLPPEYDYIITTYDSFTSGTMVYEDGQKKARNFGKKTPGTGAYNGQAKRDALEKLSENSYVLMDESHTAGGEGSNISGYLQYVTAKAKGLTFLSATFAKRPGNMPIYSLRTAISKAGVKVSELIDAVKRGGATFQEIMSKALTEAGQMIRRERDMTGVTIDWRGIEDEEVIQKQREQYDKIIGLFNDIINFQRTYIDPIIDQLNDEAAETQGEVDHTPGTRDMGINNTPFASRTYNMVQQVLLSLKAEEVAKRAIEHLKAGRKPVIALSNTNEGAADDATGLAGEDMEMPDLGVNLKKGLQGTLRIQKKDDSGNATQSMIPMERLPEEAQQRYAEIMEAIENSSSGLSLSPIDVIKNELKKAGYKVGELTGRQQEFVYNSDGTVKRVKRTDTDKKRTAANFNNGNIDAIIINRSAGTGISLHASSKYDDQRQRIMIVAQAQPDVNDEVQMRGRIDRTGQVLRGMYEYVVSQIPSEQRLLMMLKAKLRSLDANTTSSQKSKFNEMQVQDIMNKYGDQIVVQYLAENPEIYAKLADPLKWGDSVFVTPPEALVESASRPQGDGATASKILGRMALLTVKEQEKMLDDIGALYQNEIDRLNEMGENDLEITEMPLKAKTLSKQVWEQGIDPDSNNPFADNTYVEKVNMDVLRKPMKASEVKASQERLLGGKTWDKYKQETLAKVDEWAEKKKAETTETITERAKKKAAAEQERYVKGAKKAQEKNQMTDEEIERNGQIQYENIYKEEIKKLDDALAAIEAQKQVFVDALETFTTDGVYALPQNIYDLGSMTFEPGFGKLIDIKISDNMSPNASTISFATLDGRRKITIPINGKVKQQKGEKAQIFPTINSLTAQARSGWFGQNIANTLKVLEQNTDNWDKLTSTAARKDGYIITGNLLKALVSTREQGVGGKLISYTTDTGEVRQGILMPDNFEPKGLTSKTPISAKKDELKYKNDKVESADGDVSIRVTGRWDWNTHGYNTLELTVPKSSKRGGKYFNDETLLSLMNEQFEGSSKMRAEFKRENLDAVMKRLDELGVTVAEEHKEDNSPKRMITTHDPMEAINQASESWRQINGRPVANNKLQEITDMVNSLANRNDLKGSAPTYIINSRQDIEALKGQFSRRVYNEIERLYADPDTGAAYIPRAGIVVIFSEHLEDAKEAEAAWWHEQTHGFWQKTPENVRRKFGEDCLMWLKKNRPDLYNHITKPGNYPVYDWLNEACAFFIGNVAIETYGTERFLTGNFVGNPEICNFANELLNHIKNGRTKQTNSGANQLRRVGEGEQASATQIHGSNQQGRERGDNILRSEEEPELQEVVDPIKAIELSAKRWKRERNDAIAGEDTPEKHSAKAVYDERLNRVETVFSEAYQDAMVSLKTAQNAIAGDNVIPDSQNAYMAENLMHGKNKNEMDLYNKELRDPLIETINKIMNLTDMNWGDVDRYVYTKSGLERNREFFVRDWMEAELNKHIHSYEDLNDAEQDIYDRMANGIITKFEDGDIDEAERDKKLRQALQEAHIRYVRNVEYDWQKLKLEKYQDLKDGMITFPEYLEEVNRFIRYNIDGGFKAEEHDYSGFRAMFGDEEGNYDEAEIIDELMKTEAAINSADDSFAVSTVDTLWEQINAATQYGLGRYRNAGMRSDEDIDRVESMFHFYVPMRGFKAATGEDMYQYFTGKDKSKSYVGGLLKHAKGRGSEAQFPISTIFAMSYKAISDCNQNLVNQKFYRLCQANPNDLVVLSDSWAVYNELTGEWEESTPGIPEDATEDEVREITLAWEEQMRQLAKEKKAKKIKGKAEFDYKPMDKKNQSEHIVDVRINGQPRKMIVTSNPRMAQALNGQLRFEHGKNVFSSWNAAIKNMMATFFTSYSPTFALRNMFRDWTHFRTMLGVREGHGYAAQANKYYRQSLFKMIGLFKKYRNGTLDESKEMERDFKDFMDNGGITGFVFMQKIDDIQKEMENIYKKQKAGKPIRLNNNLWEKVLGAVEALNEGIENNARFATYRASRHYAGRTKARSAYDAKEITVNFNRKGAGGKTAGFKSQNKMVEDAAKAFGVTSQILGEGRIFFNATVQAIATTFKNFQNADGSLNKPYIAKWAAKYALPPFMFGLLLPAINKALANAFGGDDDDPYANLPEWTRRRNLCFYIGNDNFITIPVGQELAAFLALGDIVAGNSYAPDLKPVDRNVGDEMVDVMNTFSPVDISTKITKGGLMEDPISEVTGRTFSVLAPLVAIEQNLGWTGRPIYREDKFQNDQYTPEYQMVYQSTNPVLVNASKLLHDLGGGDDITRGKLEVNPAIIQYLWEQYTGGPGKVFSNTISIGKDAKDILTGNESDFNIRKVEGLKAFVSQGDDRTQYYRTQAKYRKYKDNAEKLYNDVKGYESGAAENPEYLLKLENISKGEDFVRMQIIREADKQLSQINKAANKAEGKEKKELRRLYNEQVKAVVDMLDEVGKE